MKIGIVGNGYVGGATALLKNRSVEVQVYDVDPEKCVPRGIEIDALLNCSFIFVCVPTPMDSEGKCSLHLVEKVVGELTEKGFDSERLIIKSTVPVGTSRKLNTMFMPEFLTEQNWREDFLSQKNWILGTNVRHDKIRDEIYLVFDAAWHDGVLDHRPHMTFSTTEEAELTKYVRNSFLATKVAFFNEIEEFCRVNNVSYRKVRELTLYDDRIGDSHTSVPGPDGKRGFGGTCFPKDVSSLLHQILDKGMVSYILNAARNRNIDVDRQERDWESDKGRAVLE
jgi:nucleotide sugar dehydrogenase